MIQKYLAQNYYYFFKIEKKVCAIFREYFQSSYFIEYTKKWVNWAKLLLKKLKKKVLFCWGLSFLGDLMYSEPHKSWPPFSEAGGFLCCQVGNALRPPPLACREIMAAKFSRQARGGGRRALPTWQRRNPPALLKGGHDLCGSLYIKSSRKNSFPLWDYLLCCSCNHLIIFPFFTVRPTICNFMDTYKISSWRFLMKWHPNVVWDWERPPWFMTRVWVSFFFLQIILILCLWPCKNYFISYYRLHSFDLQSSNIYWPWGSEWKRLPDVI